MKKYEFTGETKEIKLLFRTAVLHRIRATVSFGFVKIGDLGGWIEKEENLSHEGKPMAFSLGAESGFSWIGEYDITADELLSGTGGNTETKTEQAERLILDLLADGKEMASEDIVKAAAEAGISERTVQNAKRSMGGILGARRVGSQWYNFIKKKQPPETAK